MDALDTGLDALGLSANGERRRLLAAYIEEIELWNRKVDLVRYAGREELVTRHILDSLAPAGIISTLPPREWADFGSGAGLPGIPLAIALEERRFVLVERSGKRAAFLRGVVAVLNLRDRVEVVEADVGSLDRTFSGIIFRAFRPFAADVVESIARTMRSGGTMAAYKGRLDALAKELPALEPYFDAPRIEHLDVPLLAEERNLVIAMRK